MSIPYKKYVRLTQTEAAIATSDTQVVAANDDRCYLLLINDSIDVIYLKIGATAVENEGIRLNASGGSFEMSDMNRNLTRLEVRGINNAISGTSNLLVVEGAWSG